MNCNYLKVLVLVLALALIGAALSPTASAQSSNMTGETTATLNLYVNSSDPATTPTLGAVHFFGNNDQLDKLLYSAIKAEITDETEGAEDAILSLSSMTTGSLDQTLNIAGGMVGIGKANPAYTLDVDGTINATSFVGDGSGLSGVGGETATTATIALDSQKLNGQNPSYYLNAGSNTQITGDWWFTENVGIGTGAPGAALDVVGNIDASGDITSGDDYFISEDGRIQVTGDSEYLVFNGSSDIFDVRFYATRIERYLTSVSDPDTRVQFGYSNILQFITGGTEAMRIDANQNVGIGTTSPVEELELSGNSTSSVAFKINNDDTSAGQSSILFAEAGTTKWGIGLSDNSGLSKADFHIFEDGSSGSPRFTVKDGGNVGVGTSSPGEKLQVNGKIKSTDEINIAVGSASDPGYTFYDDTDTGMYRSSANGLGFATNGTERVIIDNSGITVKEQALFMKEMSSAPSTVSDEAVLYSLEGGGEPAPLPLSPGGPPSEAAFTGNPAEMYVKDGNGGETLISPHGFVLYRPEADDPLPWSFKSQNVFIGRMVNADMSGALRALEELTGEQFLFYEDMPFEDTVDYNAWQTSETLRLIKVAKEEIIAQDPWVEIPLEEAYEFVEEMAEAEVLKTIVKHRINWETMDVETYEVEQAVTELQPTGQIAKRLKADVRFDEDTGKLYRPRTVDDVVLPVEPYAQVSQYVLDRIWMREARAKALSEGNSANSSGNSLGNSAGNSTGNSGSTSK